MVTQAYEGGHPDHDTTVFAVHAASALLERTRGRAPSIVEMTAYHSKRVAGPSADTDATTRGEMETGLFLPRDTRSKVRLLAAEGRELKRALLACFRTQERVLEPFSVDAERFRCAPKYVFAKPPHVGKLLYETRP